MTKIGRSCDALGIFIACLCLFILGLPQQEIIGFEARFYVFALEMLRNGPSWFPTTYNQFYPDYPATSTFFIYAFAKLFGHLDKWIAVLPSAIAAAISVSFTFMIGAMQSRKLGWMAASFMLLTNTFVLEARTISPDQYVVAATTIAFYLAYSAQLTGRNLRLAWLPVLFLFGMACRGPIGFVVPAGVISVFYILENHLKKFFVFSIVSFVTLLVSGVVYFCIAYHAGGSDLVQAVWRMEVAGRLQDATLPWYFYLTDSMGSYAISYPLVLFAMFGLGNFLFRRELSSEAKFLWKLIGWILIILIGLSIPAGKKPRYLLSMVPALSLFCGALFVLVLEGRYLTLLRNLVKSICFLLPTFGLFAVLVMGSKYALYPPAIGVFVLLQGYLYLVRSQEEKMFVAASISFVMIFIFVLQPINLHLNAARFFVGQVESLRHGRDEALVFYHENPDGLPIKYFANVTSDAHPQFVDSAEVLARLQGKNMIVTSAEYFLQLPVPLLSRATILYAGNLGREPMVVFVLSP